MTFYEKNVTIKLPSKNGKKSKELDVIDIIKNQIQSKNLIIIKNIVKQLTVEDCFSGPEQDRDLQYNGWIFKFCPMYEDIKLYIKIRVENTKKSVCLSVHEFGMYDN